MALMLELALRMLLVIKKRFSFYIVIHYAFCKGSAPKEEDR